ncbi:MAG: hypothetical protein AAFY88_20900, partial [Acidobacteriota bacterium]
ASPRPTCTVDAVEIRWPDGEVDRLEDVDINALRRHRRGDEIRAIDVPGPGHLGLAVLGLLLASFAVLRLRP